jgi:uncharacterized delta-60 repeat protein
MTVSGDPRAYPIRIACGLAAVGVSLFAAAATAQAAPGDLDLSFAGFGVGGALVTNQPAGWYLVDMAPMPDGKRVLAGTSGGKILVVRHLASGLPDPSFGANGAATIAGDGTSMAGTSVAVQDDGKIVVAGWANAVVDFVVVRFTADGQPDTTFGTNGVVVTDFDGGDDHAWSVLVQPDGKIVAAGYADIGGDSDFAIARYHPDGQLDTGFAGDGKGSAGFGGDDSGAAVALGADGKLVMVGSHAFSLDDDFAVARFNPNGSPDTGFGGGDGKVPTGFGGLGDHANAVLIQPDGKIVAVGDDGSEVKAARYLVNGLLDPSFDDDGKRSIGGLNGSVSRAVLQPDGKIVLLGTHKVAEDDFRLAFYRLMPDSRLDSTFGESGHLVVDLIDGEQAYGLDIQPDGRLVALGLGRGVRSLVRLWPDGSFDVGGRQVLSFNDPGFPPGSSEIGQAMAVQPDGRIILAGEVVNSASTESDAALARFLPDGQPDASFGTAGRVLFGFGVYNGARAVAVQPDGKIVTAGYFRTGNTINFMVARFNANGTPDSTFGLAGQNLIDFAGGDDYAWALALAPNGKIVVAGEARNGPNTVFGVARFNSNGSLDDTFNRGKLFVRRSDAVHSAKAVIVQPDSKVVVAGRSGDDFALVRLTDTGVQDMEFGVGGWTITAMGGPAIISALIQIPTTGWLVAAGTRQAGSDMDFALAHYAPDGSLGTCGSRDEECGRWPSGKAFVNWGPSDSAWALAWRSDGVVVAAGCADGQFAWAQIRPTWPLNGSSQLLKGTGNFIGTGECAAGAAFVGPDRILLGGKQIHDGDQNFALARFETTLQPNVPPPTSSPVPTASPTPEPSATSTASPTTSPTHTSSPTASTTASPSRTATASPTVTATFSPTATAAGTATGSPTPSATTPTDATRTPELTPTPTTLSPAAGRIYLPRV